MHGSDIGVVHLFQPDSLPDTADSRVPDTLWLQHLFAARFVALIGVVRYAHCQFVFPIMNERGDIQRKRAVAAPVPARLVAVDIYRAGVVHRAEMQQCPLARVEMLHDKAARIPQRLARAQGLPHAGKSAFQRKGDTNIALPRGGSFRRFGNGILPGPVQILPRAAPELRARVGVQGNILHRKSGRQPVHK